MRPNDALAELQALLRSDFEISRNASRLDARLGDDLDLDSLDVTELLQLLEERTAVEIPLEDLETLVTVGDVVNLLVELADPPKEEVHVAAAGF